MVLFMFVTFFSFLNSSYNLRGNGTALSLPNVLTEPDTELFYVDIFNFKNKLRRIEFYNFLKYL